MAPIRPMGNLTINGEVFNLTTLTHTHTESVLSQEDCRACVAETFLYRTTGRDHIIG